jgi:hypothetical protein
MKKAKTFRAETWRHSHDLAALPCNFMSNASRPVVFYVQRETERAALASSLTDALGCSGALIRYG